MSAEEPTTGTIAAWIASAGVVITAAGGFILNYVKQRHDREAGHEDRLASRITHLEGKIEETQAAHLECEKKHAEVCGRIEVVEERSKECEEDRLELSQRVKSLEETVRQ